MHWAAAVEAKRDNAARTRQRHDAVDRERAISLILFEDDDVVDVDANGTVKCCRSGSGIVRLMVG